MTCNVRQLIGRSYEWLTHRPAYLLLVGSDCALGGESPRRFAGAWWGLMLGAVAWGAAVTMVWNQSYGFFGEITGIRIMPAVAAMTFLVIWPFRRAVASAADIIGGADRTARAVLASATVVLLVLAMVSAKPRFYPTSLMPDGWEWVLPVFEDCRVLLLMPVWGAWSMLIATQFCRPNERTEPAVAAFTRGCGPIAAVMMLAIPCAMTWFYFDFLGRFRLPLCGIMTVGAIVISLLICRRAGGLTRQTLLATNILSQLLLLLAYLVFQNRAGV